MAFLIDYAQGFLILLLGKHCPHTQNKKQPNWGYYIGTLKFALMTKEAYCSLANLFWSVNEPIIKKPQFLYRIYIILAILF